MDGCHSPVTHTQYSLSAEHAPLTHSIPVPMHCICCTRTHTLLTQHTLHHWCVLLLQTDHCIGTVGHRRPFATLQAIQMGSHESFTRTLATIPLLHATTGHLMHTHTSHHSCSRSPPQNIPPFVSLLSERDIQANKHPSLPISRLVQFVSLGHGPQQHQNEWLDRQMSLGQSVYALWATLNQAANITAWNSANVCSPFAFLVLPAIFGR